MRFGKIPVRHASRVSKEDSSKKKTGGEKEKREAGRIRARMGPDLTLLEIRGQSKTKELWGAEKEQ